MSHKEITDLVVVGCSRPAPHFSHLTLSPADGHKLPEILPGQFAQFAATTLLRRPICISDADPQANTLSILVADVGENTHYLASLREGDRVNAVLPLGNGFDTDAEHPLLVGGGVGVAPLLMLAKIFAQKGITPDILLGARSANLLLLSQEFEKYGRVHLTTDDGTCGTKGLVTDHKIWNTDKAVSVYCCGPAPMMKAVARKARERGWTCVVSLENMMACGLGACLCCVEKTVRGNVCVCTDGPVFNIEELTWN